MEKFHIKIKRQLSGKNWWDNFEVSSEPQYRLLDMLETIRRYPVDQKGQACSPVTFDAGCERGLCGRCTVLVNGAPKLMCQTRVSDLPSSFTLEPLDTFEVIKDLLVDRPDLLASEDVSLTDVAFYPEYQPLLSEQSLDMGCIDCGACLQVCPRYAQDESFKGARLALDAFETIQKQPKLKNEIIKQLIDAASLEACDGAQACVVACPKEIPLDQVWGFMKREVTLGLFKRFF